MLVTVTLDNKKLFKLLKGAEEAVPLYSCDEQLKKVNETIDKLDNDCDDVLNDEFLDSIVDTLLNFDLLVAQELTAKDKEKRITGFLHETSVRKRRVI